MEEKSMLKLPSPDQKKKLLKREPLEAEPEVVAVVLVSEEVVEELPLLPEAKQVPLLEVLVLEEAVEVSDEEVAELPEEVPVELSEEPPVEEVPNTFPRELGLLLTELHPQQPCLLPTFHSLLMTLLSKNYSRRPR